MRSHSRILTLPSLATASVLVTVLALALALLVPALTAPAEARRWAPADGATIKPGVQMFTKGAQCTGNFVFTDARGAVYVGYAAHCAGRGSATDTDGCTTRSRPLGTRVRFARGATAVTAGETVGRGRLVYSSWRAMRKARTRRPHVCAANDFALVRVGPRHVHKVNPSVPFWGGPTGVASTPDAGARVVSYGRSSVRPGSLLSPKEGRVVDRTYRGWGSDLYTVTPGVPGDSGSGFMNGNGKAFGVLSTVALAPYPASNGVGDLRRQLRFARRHADLPRLRLVRGTAPFSGTLGH
jgi:hypothetical protein